MAKFDSAFGIGEEVSFHPPFRYQQSLGIKDEELEGKVMSIRFTPAKVFYYIFSDHYGIIFEDVDSKLVGKSMWTSTEGFYLNQTCNSNKKSLILRYNIAMSSLEIMKIVIKY